MYNGRQQHIQTESIQDQSVQKNPSMNTEMGKALLDMSRTKIPAMKNKNTWQKEKCTRSETAPAHHKKRK